MRGAARETVLENGVRIVTEEMREVRSVSLAVLVDAGPVDEEPGQEGLAHLVEHLLFQGTSSRSARQIAQLMDGAGGHVGGFTSRDYTCYHATVLDDHVPYALDLLGDVLLNSVFPEEAVAKETSAVVSELEAQGDAPDERVHARLRARVFPDHALGRPLAGRPETVRALSREDLIYFVHRHYTPDRLVLAAAGNVRHDDFVAEARDAFWRLLGQAPDASRKKPAPPSGGVSFEPLAVSRAYFSLGLPAPAYADADRYAMHVFARLFGGGISSRLYRVVREERGLAYGIGSRYLAYRDAGLLVVEGSASPDRLGDVLALVLGELAGLLDGSLPIEEEELVRTRTQIGAEHLIAGDDPHTRMSRLATQALYFGRPLPAAEIVAAVEAVDSGRLEALRGRLVAEGGTSPTLAVVGPDATPVAPLDDALSRYSGRLEAAELRRR